MKSQHRSALSMLLLVSMILSLVLTSALAVGISAADTVDLKKLDKLIVDFRDAGAFLEHGEVYKHSPTTAEPDPDTGGLYKFDPDKEAMQVLYAESKVQKPFRIMTKIRGLTADYKYWVVVYQAKTSSAYDIYLHNSPGKGQRVDVIKGAKDTGGEWVISDAFDISGEANGASILSRWMTGQTVNTLNFVTEDKSAEFYIKEFGFFKTAEDAKTYYENADLSKSPAIYTEAGLPTTKNVVAVNYKNPTEDTTVAPAPDTSSPSLDNLPAPVIMDLSSEAAMAQCGAYFTNHTEETEGLYHFATAPDGTTALKLDYSVYGNWKPYRTMPAFRDKNKVTLDHKYVRITYMNTDVMANTITLTNNANGGVITVVENTAGSRGEWVHSNAINIDSNDILKRYNNAQHCTIQYTSGSLASEIYIKEIAFFATPEQAYAYYGDYEVAEGVTYTAMTFGSGGTGALFTGSDYGNSTVNSAEGTVDISYAEKTNRSGIKYMAKIKFAVKSSSNSSHKYVRVAYAAENPKNVIGASMYMFNDKLGNECIRLVENIADTNGKFVLSDSVLLHPDMLGRFTASGGYSSTMHNSLIINAALPGGTYKIQGLYFFPTKEAADEFTLPSSDHTISVNGNDISKYQIVIAENAPIKVVEAANGVANRILNLTGITVPVVTDNAHLSTYEILVGPSNRAKSTQRDAEYQEKFGSIGYWAYLDHENYIIGGFLPYNVSLAGSTFNRAFLFDGLSNVPDHIEITAKHEFVMTDTTIRPTTLWKLFENVENPERFTEDFDVDDGYFTEENNAKDWNYADGVMSTTANDQTLSYIHVYEPDVTYSAKLRFTAAGDNGDMGLMLRYNSAYAWVKAGYDFARGVWYITAREGLDFFETELAAAPATLTPDTWYNLTFTVDGPDAVLSVNGTEVLRTSDVTQLTPGRIAVYAKDASVSIDDVDIILLSGEGTIWKDVAHTKLPDEIYREGGSVFEMNDKSLIYTHHSGTTFKSLDNGASWERTDTWTNTYGYVNILRLNNGDWLKIASKTVNGINYKISQTSSDDGKTWVDGGTICYAKYGNNTDANAGNMNDKLLQSGRTNRIFYGQNYETTTTAVDGRMVFCEFYYSDDNGKTWTKSETDSWELVGNEKQTHFGECKILECADGSLRMYNSWNRYGCIVYTESYDNGVTWGPLVELKDFECSCSSMQFVRDPWGETDTTYYMVWVNSTPESKTSGMSRARLSLAKTTDGKNWEFLGDAWRWESGYCKGGAFINHVVDPFVKVTEDYILLGSGFSEHTALVGEPDVANWHQAQRQHIYSIPKASLPEGKYMNCFTDINSTDSYYDAVNYVVEKGLFKGMSASEFQPSTTMNRAMFVTVLGRLDGVDATKYTNVTFNDVEAGSWYAAFVEWAAANGIVNGTGNGMFGVNGNITIEQACNILMRYANGKTAQNTGLKLTDFNDANQVSSWAVDGVEWALANGIYGGTYGRILPVVSATRATVATMFYNFVTIFGE